MPQINRIRVNNVKYNFGTQVYDDFVMRFNCQNTIYDLANGGGKSLLMLLLMQNMLPNCTLDDKQPIEKLFRQGSGNTCIHSLVEWKLDPCYQKDGFRFMTTGFCARKGRGTDDENQDGQEQTAAPTASVEYFNYCIFYREFGDNDIKNLPLVSNGERITYNGLKAYLRDLEKGGYKYVVMQALLTQLGAVIRSYGKGEALVLAGEPSRRVGIVLSGELEAYRPAPGGVRIPIARVEPGGVFGDVLGGSSLSSPVTVLAAAPCEVLLLPYERLLLSDGSPAHQRVVQNLVRTISDKYFSLSHRIDLLVMKSLRAKVAAYLLSEAARAHSLTFSIPFSRIQLADYLNCDRSALSRELSTMQREGLIDTYRSSFKLLEPDALQQMVQ